MKLAYSIHDPFNSYDTGLPYLGLGESLIGEAGETVTSIFPIDLKIDVINLKNYKLGKYLPKDYVFVGNELNNAIPSSSLPASLLPSPQRRDLANDNVFYSINQVTGEFEYKALIGDISFLNYNDSDTDDINDTHTVFTDTPIFNGQYLRVPVKDIDGSVVRNDIEEESEAETLFHELSELTIGTTEYIAKKEELDQARLSIGSIYFKENDGTGKNKLDLYYLDSIVDSVEDWRIINDPSGDLALRILTGNVNWSYEIYA